MKKAAIILNPISGGGKSEAALKKIRQLGALEELEYKVFRTTRMGEASNLAEQAKLESSLIIVIGGDGTVNEVGSKLIGSDVSLAIVPAGSGNGLARHLGINSISKSVKAIKGGRVLSIDTASLNNRNFLNMAGTGLDAEVSFAFAGTERRGWYNYLLIMLRLGSNTKLRDYVLKVNGEELHRKACMISVANSSQYGNEAKIAPKASIVDGVLDICILKRVNLLQAVSFLIKLMTGTLRNNSYFESFQSTEIRIENSNNKVHLDGEPKFEKDPIEIKILPQSLNVIHL